VGEEGSRKRIKGGGGFSGDGPGAWKGGRTKERKFKEEKTWGKKKLSFIVGNVLPWYGHSGEKNHEKVKKKGIQRRGNFCVEERSIP